MFKNTFQSGFLSILYSIGSKPLQIWDKKVRNGHIKRITDQDIQVRMAMMNYGFQIRDSNEGSLFAEISQSRRRPLLEQGPSSRGLLCDCENFDNGDGTFAGLDYIASKIFCFLSVLRA